MKDIRSSCVVDNETYEELEGKNSREHPEPDESMPLIHYSVQSNSNRQRLGRARHKLVCYSFRACDDASF